MSRTMTVLCLAAVLAACSPAVEDSEVPAAPPADEPLAESAPASVQDNSAPDSMPEAIERALADQSRPAEDRELDINRHPAEVLLFAGVERGWSVADLAAGGGYYSRVLSTAVGENGRVYAHNPDWVAERFPEPNEALAALSAQRANMAHIVAPLPEFSAAIDGELDAVFLVLFYHDTVWAGTDRAAMNQAVFDALKPGGIFLVIDHHAVAGTGLAHVQDLHRIDAADVLAEITAAGFVLDRQSDMLANPEDPRDISVFGEGIRRQTDRFVYLFRKPED